MVIKIVKVTPDAVSMGQRSDQPFTVDQRMDHLVRLPHCLCSEKEVFRDGTTPNNSARLALELIFELLTFPLASTTGSKTWQL
jgi:hypothetical protein